MTGQFYSHLNPKCDWGVFEEKGGCGVFAGEPSRKGELICLWGGRIVAENEIDPNMEYITQRILQIEEGLYLEAPLPLEPTDCFNHSCEPNVGFTGQIVLVAMRDIHAGEEINFDYAMCDGSSYDEFKCYCGSEQCRGSVKGTDWMRPELWAKIQRLLHAVSRTTHRETQNKSTRRCVTRNGLHGTTRSCSRPICWARSGWRNATAASCTPHTRSSPTW